MDVCGVLFAQFVITFVLKKLKKNCQMLLKLVSKYGIMLYGRYMNVSHMTVRFYK